MLQLSETNYNTNYNTNSECFIVNFDVLLKKDAFQKNVTFCKKVSFDTFKDIIYIPTYNKETMSHLWWSMSELKYIHNEVKQEIIYIINNSLINIDVKCAFDILCKYHD